MFAYLQSFLYLCSEIREITKNKYMKTLLKNLGAILVLLGVACLAVYYFGVQKNILLVASMVLEVAGVLSYIFINRRLG